MARGGNRPSGAGWPPRSAYLHIPFCHRRCFYCDFPVVPLGDRAGAEPGQPGSASIAHYLAQLLQEIASAPPGPPLSTVYVGGGTPSWLAPHQLRELLAALRHRFGIAPGAELSLELDPASFDEGRLAGYLAAGITRVSLGVQSFDDAVLEKLGRRHRGADALQAAAWLRAAEGRGQLGSWSLDLIQALPGQTFAAWGQQLRQAMALEPPHLSIYDLILEPGTVFERLERRGQLDLPEHDLAADLQECTVRTVAAAGYGHYEVSNYARPGHASRHNRVYWSGAGWWGFGLGATAAPWGRRQARPRTREAYGAWLAQRLEPPAGPAAADPAPGPGLPFDERLLVGLRRREGVALQALAAAAGVGADAMAALQAAWQPYRQAGLLLQEGPRWRLSDPDGLALSNVVLRELMAWWADWGPPEAADPPPSP